MKDRQPQERHSYYEGLFERNMFVNLMDRLGREGYRFQSLQKAYERTDLTTVPDGTLGQVTVPGGVKMISCQEEFRQNNYFSIIPTIGA